MFTYDSIQSALHEIKRDHPQINGNSKVEVVLNSESVTGQMKKADYTRMACHLGISQIAYSPSIDTITIVAR